MTLDHAIRIALENNPDLRSLRARVDAAKGRASQARLWPNPELTLSAEDWSTRAGGFSDAKKLAGVEQVVPFPGKKRLDGLIGRSGVTLSEAELSLWRVELIRDVKTAFYQVLTAERLVDVSLELLDVAESLASTAAKRVAAGAAADHEQLRTEIPLEQSRTELSGFHRDLATARQTLAVLLGRHDLRETPLSGSLADAADMTLLSRGPAQWLTNHPSIISASDSRSQAGLALRRAGLEPYPDARFGIAGGRESGPAGGGVVQFGISVPLPIIDRSKGRKREAEANVRIAEAGYASAEQRLLRDWSIAVARFRTAAEQVASYRERILPKADEALRLVKTGFESGKFNFIDLLDTQRTTAEARLAYQRKLLDLNIAQAELESLAGRQRPPDLNNSQP